MASTSKASQTLPSEASLLLVPCPLSREAMAPLNTTLQPDAIQVRPWASNWRNLCLLLLLPCRNVPLANARSITSRQDYVEWDEMCRLLSSMAA